jgi:hypothetical protein
VFLTALNRLSVLSVSISYKVLSFCHHWIFFSDVYGVRPMGSDGPFGLAPNFVLNMEFFS